MFNTKEEIENWLLELNIGNFVIKDDLTVDVNQNVYIINKISELPVKFGIVKGYFYCNRIGLTSLKGCPDIVFGNFNCNYNKLKNLEYCPKVINGSFSCDNNELTSLKGCSEIFDRDFSCIFNKLSSLQYGPKEVKGNFDCSGNRLKTLKFLPKLHQSLDLRYNKIISLKGCPQEVNGFLYVGYNKLKSLKYAPQKIKNEFDCSHNKLTSLEYCPQEIDSSFWCHNNFLKDIKHIPLKLNDFINISANPIEEYELLNFDSDISNVSNFCSDFHQGLDKNEFIKFLTILNEKVLLKNCMKSSLNKKKNKYL